MTRRARVARRQAAREGVRSRRRPGRLTCSRSRPTASSSPSGSTGRARGSRASASRHEREALLHGLPRPRGPELPRRRRRDGRAREGARPARVRGAGHGRRAADRRRARRARRRDPPARLPHRPTSTAGSSSSPRRPTGSLNRRVSRDAEARSLLCNVADVPELCSLHPPGRPAARSDRGRRLDRRRVSRARAADPRRHRRASSAPSTRELARTAPRASAVGEGAPPDLRGRGGDFFADLVATELG